MRGGPALAEQCGGAWTPALGQASEPLSLTDLANSWGPASWATGRRTAGAEKQLWGRGDSQLYRRSVFACLVKRLVPPGRRDVCPSGHVCPGRWQPRRVSAVPPLQNLTPDALLPATLAECGPDPRREAGVARYPFGRIAAAISHMLAGQR